MIAFDDTRQGPPLVLIHGVGASRIVWRRVTPGLRRRWRVLAPDLPGFGASAPVRRPFDLAATAEALGDALARRVDQPFELLGNSLGGAVALELAYLRPDLVRSLILVAPAGFSPRPWPLPVLAGALAEPTVALRRMLGTPLVASASARRALLWGTVAEPERMRARDARTMLTASRGASQLGSAVSAVLSADLFDHLAELDRPLGLLWGERDRIVPIGSLERLRARRPDALVTTIRSAGHVPQLETPAAFVVKVRRLLDQLGANTA